MNVENKCIAFLKEYRAHPERYLPLTDKQYKHYNEWEEESLENEPVHEDDNSSQKVIQRHFDKFKK